MVTDPTSKEARLATAQRLLRHGARLTPAIAAALQQQGGLTVLLEVEHLLHRLSAAGNKATAEWLLITVGLLPLPENPVHAHQLAPMADALVFATDAEGSTPRDLVPLSHARGPELHRLLRDVELVFEELAAGQDVAADAGVQDGGRRKVLPPSAAPHSVGSYQVVHAGRSLEVSDVSSTWFGLPQRAWCGAVGRPTYLCTARANENAVRQ
ncbi:hypothetical protein CYMTET_27216 [Cymbomonas tetramitiformis]|uniref:Uncharacterized protein n=1 Tax=Cymbomonas tetramitiformis TaxID=36881 RepID=A0AAE0FQX3_9CHLO|nr:hypothetical protein CYMTET_27216 [Cymbomonas tetramitiformis]